MLQIETRGTWREMGRQLGEAFRDDIRDAQELFAPWLVTEREKYAPAVARLEALLRAQCPEVLDEALGMGEGAGMDPDLALGYRLFNQISMFLREECSVAFIRGGENGPLLGRNCDLGQSELRFQLCHVRRPTGEPATIEMTYVGLVAGLCLNEHGLGMAGASAMAEPHGAEGLPSPVLAHWLMHRCRTVAEARALFAQHRFLGKPANYVVADETGDSALFEFVCGLPPREAPSPPGGRWQAATNFMVSQAPLPPLPPTNLGNFYARYGRLAQMLGYGLVEPSVTGMHRLLTDIANPGAVCPDIGMITAYSHIMDLRARTMHLWPGHPAEVEPVEVRL